MIAREGWSIVGFVTAVTAVVHWFAGAAWAWPLWLVLFFVIQFFRDPTREISGAAGAIVSPAHGKVVALERARDPYLERDALKLSIFMNVFSVHSNRIPIAGKIRGRWYHAGRFFNAAWTRPLEKMNATRCGSKQGLARMSLLYRSPA